MGHIWSHSDQGSESPSAQLEFFWPRYPMATLPWKVSTFSLHFLLTQSQRSNFPSYSCLVCHTRYLALWVWYANATNKSPKSKDFSFMPFHSLPSGVGNLRSMSAPKASPKNENQKAAVHFKVSSEFLPILRKKQTLAWVSSLYALYMFPVYITDMQEGLGQTTKSWTRNSKADSDIPDELPVALGDYDHGSAEDQSEDTLVKSITLNKLLVSSLAFKTLNSLGRQHYWGLQWCDGGVTSTLESLNDLFMPIWTKRTAEDKILLISRKLTTSLYLLQT